MLREGEEVQGPGTELDGAARLGEGGMGGGGWMGGGPRVRKSMCVGACACACLCVCARVCVCPCG